MRCMCYGLFREQEALGADLSVILRIEMRPYRWDTGPTTTLTLSLLPSVLRLNCSAVYVCWVSL